MKNEYIGESFLNRLYKDLYNSDEVIHTAINSDTKEERNAYLFAYIVCVINRIKKTRNKWIKI